MTDSTTALILVDLQDWIVGMDWAPHPGAQVVAACLRLREEFRAAGAPVVLVRYLRQDGRDGGPEAARNQFVPGLTRLPGELLITKHGLDAFEDTALQVRLREQGVSSTVIVGLSTAHGVAATAVSALAADFAVTVVHDATASVTTDEHRSALKELSAAGAVVIALDQVLGRPGRSATSPSPKPS